MESREQICQRVYEKLTAAIPALPSVRATIGLDGFVDEIIAVVEKREGFDRYEPVPTIARFGEKISRAAGQSSNYELVVRQRKLGGNGPIMANALAAAGVNVTYVGALGYPQVHPVFQSLVDNATVVSVADAAHTDALEFGDGKLMLGKLAPLSELTWANVVGRVGRDRLLAMVNASQLFGFVNWTMIPHLSDVWERLRTEIFPKAAQIRRKFFVDLADPEKRTREDIRGALAILTKFDEQADVILGLNLKESGEVAAVLGLPEPADPEAAIEETARRIRAAMNVHCVVVHPRKAAAAATADEGATFHGPFVDRPKISTGAGDHFNAGFALGRTLGFSVVESLCTGVATSGYYVRTAESPTAEQLAAFVRDLPAPQA